ncbi:MAG: hypothetical protein ABIH42_06975 [Planctomycetota bacterium]
MNSFEIEKKLSELQIGLKIRNRFLQHADIIIITGKSYRLKDKAVDKKSCETGTKK